ncbi:MAG: hypothetical protein ACYCYM_13810 [Saccharofermentanales bacterium]
MATVKNILKVNKENNSNTQTALDYAFCGNGFSIWSYAAKDVKREGGTKQNLLFEPKEARELQCILIEYLNQLDEK